MGQSTSMTSPSVSPEGQQSQDQPESYGYDVKIVEEINKRQLGKLIIKYCGHEGTADNEQTASLRKLLQRAITNLEPQQEKYPGVWRDAQLKIFDLYGNGYVVQSGQGSAKFVVQITGKGDVELSKIQDESWLASMKALLKRQNSTQLQIEGPPPAQGNSWQSWWPFSGSRSGESHLSASGIEVSGSTSEDVAGQYGQHQDQNNESNLPRGEGQTDNDESGLASGSSGGDQTDPQEGQGEKQQCGVTNWVCDNRFVAWFGKK